MKLEMTANLPGQGATIEGVLTTVKAGARLYMWPPEPSAPIGIVVLHPDDPARLVYFDGVIEELKTANDGAVIMPPVIATAVGSPLTLSIGVAYTELG